MPRLSCARLRLVHLVFALLACCLLPAGALGQAAEGLTLESALQRACDFSPLLKAADLDRHANEARLDQAGRRPNPTLSLEAENLAGSGEYSGLDASEWVLAVAQEFDLAGKRGRLQDVLRAEASLLENQRRATRLDLTREVGLAFGQVWSAQSALDLAREKHELARELEREIATRLERGGSSPLDLTRAKVGTASAEIELFHASQTLDTARRQLAGLWGDEVADFDAVTIPEEFWQRPATGNGVATVAANPDLTHWDSAALVQDSRLAAARSAGGLDLELNLGVKLDNASGDQALVLGGAVPLPVSDRNQDEVRALAYERDRQEQLRLDAAKRLQADLAAAVAAEATARREMDILAGQIIPLARQAYADARTAHQRGLYSLTDVLETRRHLFELRQREVDVRHRFYSSAIEIARLTGAGPVATLYTSGEEQ